MSGIQAHLAACPDDWRRLRAVLVVDIPAILEALEGAATLPDGTAKEALLAQVPAALGRTRQAAEDLVNLRSQDLALGLQVLPGADLPPPEPEPQGGLMGRVKGFSRGAGRLLEGTVDASRDTASRAASTAGAIAALSGEHISSLLGDAGRSITRPISMRMQAMAGAVGDTSLAALLLGGMASIIFPPIAPFVAGEAILRMPETYAAHLAHVSEAEARAELERSGEKSERIASILAVIRGGPVRFDTPCLSITLDPTRGTASGIILKGRYTGELIETLDRRTLETLRDKAPDEETGRALTSWLSRQA